MKINEIVKLTTAGYKAGEIKELAELEKEKPGALTLALNGSPLSDVKELITLDTPDEDGEPEGADTEPADKGGEPDYKSMYEDLKGKTAELENTIKEIQKNNQHEDLSGDEKPLEDQVSEILGGLL